MRKILAIAVAMSLAVGFMIGLSWNELAAHAVGVSGIPTGNGDVNGDGAIDISDAVYLLDMLFKGGSPLVQVPSMLPATGQITCYDSTGNVIACEAAPGVPHPDFPFEDGAVQAGCPMVGRFIDNKDETVTDTCTGLMWQKHVAAPSQALDPEQDGKVTWQNALKYCRDEARLRNKSDWRLPSINELFSLLDHSKYPTVWDETLFPNPQTTIWQWSSTSVGDSKYAVVLLSGRIWIKGGDNCYYGPVSWGDKTSTDGLYVRAVRTIQPGE